MHKKDHGHGEDAKTVAPDLEQECGNMDWPGMIWPRTAFLGCHGLTVFGVAVRLHKPHGHGEDAGTVPLDVVDRFESTDWPMMTWPGTDIDTPAWIRCHHISCDDLIHTHRLTGIVT